MQKERNKTLSTLVSAVLFEMEQFSISGLKASSQMIIEGFIMKQVEVKGSAQFNYTFTDKTRKNSIKCIFIHEPNMDETLLYSITIAKYLFDHLIALSPTNELQSNVLLLIETYSLSPVEAESGQVVTKPPPNINTEAIIQQKSNELLDIQIKKLLNEYHYKALSSNGRQVNFSIGVFPQQRTETVVKIASELFNVNTKGLLLQSRRGVEYPWDYLVSQQESSLELLKSFNWKTLLESSSTFTMKKTEGSEPFTPSVINMNEFKGSYFEKEKKDFLARKVGRDTSTKEEREKYPNKIASLINSYGDLQANIGVSMINKYVLYKKYMAIAEKERVKSK